MLSNEIVQSVAIPRLILGSGRSGTTWVLDCLAAANELRTVFEPLHPAESAMGMRYAYQVMLPGDEDELLERYFSDLAAGDVRSRWIDYRGRQDRLYPNPGELMKIDALKNWVRRWRKFIRDRKVLREVVKREGVLIKCIRANLMAGWLTRSLGFRTVLIVRHPCAVVESQCRLGAVWDPAPVIERYRSNQRLHDVTDGRYLGLLSSKLSKMEALTLNWIIENQWPVKRGLSDGYEVIYYEDLISQPEILWQRLCDALSLARAPAPSVLIKPSQQASRAGYNQAGESAGNPPRWRSRMTIEQLDSIQGMLDATKCNLYRVDRESPLRPAAAHTRKVTT